MNKAQQDALLHAITQRVIELDHRRRNDAQLDQVVQDYIDALEEVTQLDRFEIETIARQVVQDKQGRSGYHIPLKWIWAVGIAAVLVVLLLARAVGFREGVTVARQPDPIPALESRVHIVRAHLQNVLMELNVAKLYIAEHAMTYGKYPESFEAIGLEPKQLTKSEHIGAIELTGNGAILVTLGPVFGDSERLLLQSDMLNFDGPIKWACYTTIEQRFLGRHRIDALPTPGGVAVKLSIQLGQQLATKVG